MKQIRNLVLSGFEAIAIKVARHTSVQRLLFNLIRLNRDEFHRQWSNRDIRFLSYVFARRERSRSQILQDLWVSFELNEKRAGFFVEFGATNGLTNSNTWLLETEFGWKGILAEPNPIWHRELAANRKAVIEHRCVAAKTGEVVTFITTDDSDPELSAIAEFSDGDHFSALRDKGSRISVETIALNDLLEIYQAPAHIDYLSIDTEGSEFSILSSIDFSKYRFGLISVEQNPKTEKKLQTLLESHGYVRVFPQFSQWDGWYVSAELSQRPEPPIFAPPT